MDLIQLKKMYIQILNIITPNFNQLLVELGNNL